MAEGRESIRSVLATEHIALLTIDAHVDTKERENVDSTHNLLPCPSCPWRIEQNADVIPHYNHEKACGLMSTVGDEDAFRTIMACHGSPIGKERVCNGYLAQEGWSNLNVRLMVMLGQIERPDRVLQSCKEAKIKLHANYRSVLAKLSASGISPNMGRPTLGEE